MRYYSIILRDFNGKIITTPASPPDGSATYTSYVNNQTIPGALQVEIDIPLKGYSTPMKGLMIRVWGVSLAEIAQPSLYSPRFNADGTSQFVSIEVYGGFQKGLPLANPGQNGLLMKGSILQAFGNWIGRDMTLDLIIAPWIGSNNQPVNLVLNWYANTPLSVAVSNALKIAFPDAGAPVVSISDKLVQTHDEQHAAETVEQLAYYLNSLSKSIIGGNTYAGVDIFYSNGTFFVDDGTVQTTPKQINFQDLIGQPTWIEGITMQFKCAMRADLRIGQYVKMPPAVVTTSAAASTSLVNLKSAFEGTFYLSEMRHVGVFRQPTADSWVTVYNGTPTQVQAEA